MKFENKDYKKIFEEMVNRTYDYLKSNNLKSMVLGISGGIDSTLCAAICYEIVQRHPEMKFYGVNLPCSSNSYEENRSAILTMVAFLKDGFYWEENLQKEYMLMKTTCETHFMSTNISQGNIKARLRMIYLYNIASVTHGLVMSTTNFTEELLGFFTLGGDGLSDFSPFYYLWKHEIFGLVRYLKDYEYTTFSDADKRDALQAVLDIVPTDGNGVQAGGDMAQIAPGHTYEQVDDILMRYIEYKQHHPEEFQQEMQNLYEEYGTETVERIRDRHLNSEFKRKHLPIRITREELLSKISV